MNIKAIDDNNTNFELVEIADDTNIGIYTPHCKIHRAMNKVSIYSNGGYWRCLQHNCRAGCEQVINILN